MKRSLLLLFGLALTLPTFPLAENLGPGKPAPKLEIKNWLKGQPVAELEAGKIYVVEFWATWCGPCKTSIPHLTELARANKDVTFIGVGIWEDNDGHNIQNFVDQMGEKMDYTVGYSGNKEGMAQTWMAAAGQNGIPAAFIVKDRMVQWIGHPMSMAEPLKQIKEGTFDIVAFTKDFDKKTEANMAKAALRKEFDAILNLHTEGKCRLAHDKLDKFVAEHKEFANSAEMTKFSWLATDDKKAWEKQVESLEKSSTKADTLKLAMFAIRQAKATGPLFECGTKAIQAALSGPNGSDLLTLQYANQFYKAVGDTKSQLEITNKILAVLPNSDQKNNTEFREAMEKQKRELESKGSGKG